MYKVYKFIKTDKGQIIVALLLIILITAALALPFIFNNPKFLILSFLLCIMFFVAIHIPGRVVHHQIKAMPEQNVQIKVLKSEHIATRYYHGYSFLFELPGGVGKSYTYDRYLCPPKKIISAIENNDTGTLFYKERWGETVITGFEPENLNYKK